MFDRLVNHASADPKISHMFLTEGFFPAVCKKSSHLREDAGVGPILLPMPWATVSSLPDGLDLSVSFAE